MLHRVRHVRRLNQVLNDNCRLSVDRHMHLLTEGGTLRKGLLPAPISQFLQFLVHNIRGLLKFASQKERKKQMVCESDTPSSERELLKEANKVLLSYHDRVDDELTKALKFIIRGIDCRSQISITVIKQQIPRNVH